MTCRVVDLYVGYFLFSCNILIGRIFFFDYQISPFQVASKGHLWGGLAERGEKMARIRVVGNVRYCVECEIEVFDMPLKILQPICIGDSLAGVDEHRDRASLGKVLVDAFLL